jgi:hypothetical protein
VVLGGLEARDRYAPMPAVGSAMSDLEVADVTNYVRQNWGNAALATAQPDMVAALRKSTSTLMNVSPNQACPSIGDPAVASAFDSNRNGLRTQIGALTDANMPERVGPLLARVRTAAGGASQADLINGMSAAYCKALRADTTLDWNQKSVRLGNFSQLVYMAASGHPVGTSSGALTGSRRTAQK